MKDVALARKCAVHLRNAAIALLCAGWATTAHAGANCQINEGALTTQGQNHSGPGYASCDLTGIGIADLAAGTLRASKTPIWYGISGVGFGDRVTVGGFIDDSTYIVTLNEAVHGSITAPFNDPQHPGQWGSGLRYRDPIRGANAGDVAISGALYYGFPLSYTVQSRDEASAQILSMTPDDIDYILSVVIPVSRRAPVFDFDAYLNVLAFAPGVTDFSHTAQLSLDLPKGLSFTSASGVFLTQVGPVNPGVPEPATWALMLVGFGLVGTVLRQRRAKLEDSVPVFAQLSC